MEHIDATDQLDPHSPEALRKHVRTYMMVFGGLLVLTLVTVGVKYLHLPVVPAILVALAIALVKGSLVACYFMHLISERKLILILMLATVFFFFGVIVYRILRPAETVAQANERALAEEAMMVEIESQPHCANCSRQVHEDWIICPTCRNRLRRVCPNCSRLVELDWSLCAWCGKDFERATRPEAMPVPTPPKQRRRGAQPQSATDSEPVPQPSMSVPSIPAPPLPAPRTDDGLTAES